MKAKHSITFRQLMKLRKITFEEFANTLGVSDSTARKYTKHPERHFTPDMCDKSDLLFRVPSGTSLKIALGKIDLEDLLEYLETIKQIENEAKTNL